MPPTDDTEMLPTCGDEALREIENLLAGLEEPSAATPLPVQAPSGGSTWVREPGAARLDSKY